MGLGTGEDVVGLEAFRGEGGCIVLVGVRLIEKSF